MNPLSISAAKPSAGYLPAVSPFNPFRPSVSRTISPLAFRCPRQALSSIAHIRAASQNPIHGTPNKRFSDESATTEMSPLPFLRPLKAGVATTVAAAAVFLAGFCLALKPSIAAPISTTPSSVETSEQDSVTAEEKEKILEEQLVSNPYDVDGLKTLMEIKIKSKKVPEAIEILDKLIELEPDEDEWPLMKSHLYAHTGEFESAKNGFNELLNKDPYRVEAYHGLVTVASQEESGEELGSIVKRVEAAIKLCNKEKKKSDARDFKLLLAQIRVLQSRYDEALKVYEELVKEEPRDFRPYLCQGIIYTMLRKNNEAEKNFEKYRRLIPKGHPYASYFDDNMIATKLFAQKMENERAMAKS